MPILPPAPDSLSAVQQLPLALLIPGLDGTGRFFEPHLESLSARYRTLAWRSCCRGQFDFPDLVAELGEATAGESAGSITVVGESFGGAIALHFALAYPGRMRLLGLVNTFCYYSRRMRIHLACRLARLLQWYGIRNLKDLVAERNLALEGIPPGGREFYRKIVAQVDHKAYCRRLELVRDVDLRTRLHEVSVPTVILAGGRDKIVPSMSAARFMAAHIPNARIHLLAGAGHALLLTPGFSLADYV